MKNIKRCNTEDIKEILNKNLCLKNYIKTTCINHLMQEIDRNIDEQMRTKDNKYNLLIDFHYLCPMFRLYLVDSNYIFDVAEIISQYPSAKKYDNLVELKRMCEFALLLQDENKDRDIDEKYDYTMLFLDSIIGKLIYKLINEVVEKHTSTEYLSYFFVNEMLENEEKYDFIDFNYVEVNGNNEVYVCTQDVLDDRIDLEEVIKKGMVF